MSTPFENTPEGRIAAIEWMRERSRNGNLQAFQTLIRLRMDYEDGVMLPEDRVAWEKSHESEQNQEAG